MTGDAGSDDPKTKQLTNHVADLSKRRTFGYPFTKRDVHLLNKLSADLLVEEEGEKEDTDLLIASSGSGTSILPCDHVLKYGECKKGDKCPFSHEEKVIKQASKSLILSVAKNHGFSGLYSELASKREFTDVPLLRPSAKQNSSPTLLRRPPNYVRQMQLMSDEDLVGDEGSFDMSAEYFDCA